jgi:hypothetical protein
VGRGDVRVGLRDQNCDEAYLRFSRLRMMIAVEFIATIRPRRSSVVTNTIGFRTFKEQVEHGRIFQTTEEVRDAVRTFVARYKPEWLVEKNVLICPAACESAGCRQASSWSRSADHCPGRVFLSTLPSHSPAPTVVPRLQPASGTRSAAAMSSISTA